MKKYKMANVVFGAQYNFPFTEFFLKDYSYDGNEDVEFVVSINANDIEFERALTPEFCDDELENVALFRKLCDCLLDKKDIILFHSSAITVDDRAYLFTAPSGTGKSTHTRLYKEYFGDRFAYVNDDKPFIKIENDSVVVYGNPWTGKHALGNNISAKVNGICKLAQAKKNAIRKMQSDETLLTLLDQTERPRNIEMMDKLLTILEKMVKLVPSFYLECDISYDAVTTSYNAMKGDNCEN